MGNLATETKSVALGCNMSENEFQLPIYFVRFWQPILSISVLVERWSKLYLQPAVSIIKYVSDKIDEKTFLDN